MPFNRLKDALSERSKAGLSVASLGQNPTRILYACVSKRMCKFDRSSGEQVVHFGV